MTSKPIRQHPLAIIIVSVQAIKSSWRELLPVLFGLYVAGKSFFALWWLLPIPLLAAYGILYWWRFTFQVSNEQLMINKGIFIRKSIQIPRQRIQVIDTTAGFLQQLFNLESLNIETAGSQENASIQALTHSQVIAIQEQLRIVQTTVTEETQIPLKQDQSIKQTSTVKLKSVESNIKLLKLEIGDLFIHALTSKSIAIIFLSSIYLLDAFSDFLAKDDIKQQAEHILSMLTTFIWLSIVVLIIFTLIVALGYTFIVYFDFTLYRNNDDMVIVHGLLEKKRTTIPLRRIQSYRLIQNPVLQKLRKIRLMIESAGSQKTGSTGSFLIIPVTSIEKCKSFFSEAFDIKDWPEIVIRSPLRSIHRYLIHTTLFPSFILIILLILTEFSMLWLSTALPLLLLGYLRFRGNGVGWNNHFIISESRLISYEKSLIPINRIQAWELRQSYFQKRRHLTTLTLHTTSGSQERGYTIRDIDTDSAQSIHEFLSERVFYKTSNEINKR